MLFRLNWFVDGMIVIFCFNCFSNDLYFQVFVFVIFCFSVKLSDDSWYGEFCRDCSFSSWFASNGNSFFINEWILPLSYFFTCPSFVFCFSCATSFFFFSWLTFLVCSLQVIDSINKCDVDIRRELFSSILVKCMKPHFSPTNNNN